ncbi:MAG: hypothetical protein H7A23_24520 [Leptospiraceae bacterium]|nr:hypothetical protein [Leptospiraceae bacterium]MCP5497730.1 hypothetical protein [Leptospiraceae bacterium]
MKVLKFLLFTLTLLLYCSNNNQNHDLFLLFDDFKEEQAKAYFSYPGRYSDQELKNNVLEEIKKLIRNTKTTLGIYAYSLSHPEVIQEIVNAHKRGVKVKILGDNDKDYTPLIQNQIPLERWKASGLQHTKVMLSDRSTLFIGTGNFSEYGLTNDWNGYLKLKVPNNMQNELEEFLENTYTKPALILNGFYFINSPDYGYLSQNAIVQAIENAKESVYYLIFDHFDPIISHALRKASRRGVQVIGIYDAPVDDEGKYLIENFYGVLSSIYEDGNTDVVNVDGNYQGGLLHHKTMIIDKKLLLTGSYNYSVNARDKNREIFIGTEDPKIVTSFMEEFDRILQKSYRQENKNFYSYEIRLPVNVTIREDDVCIDGHTFSDPILEVGKGIFKTYLYFDKVDNQNCIFRKKYKTISTKFSLNKSYSFSGNDEFWKPLEIYSRYDNQVFYSEEITGISIFHTSKPFKYVAPEYVYFPTDESISFSIANTNLANTELTFWSPGKEIKTSTVVSTNFGTGIYISNLKTSTTEKKQGVVWIEKPEEILFFCFCKKGEQLNSSIQLFLDVWQFENSIQKYKAAEILGCYSDL